MRSTLPVLAAAALVTMPWLATSEAPKYANLSYAAIELVALVGAGIGWIVFDRLAPLRRPWTLAIALAVLLVVAWFVGNRLIAHHFMAHKKTAIDVLIMGFIAGSVIRGARLHSRSWSVLVVLAAATGWLAYDLPVALYRPMRDLHSYLAAGASAAAGHSAYLQAPLTVPAAPDATPFVYPPLAVPLFEILARLPTHLVELGWLTASLAATVAALHLLGVRGRWLVVLLFWPPLTIGISVGNVAVFGFLMFALGFRFVAALVLGGAFKLQSGISALWGVRMGRWRELAAGVAILAALSVAATLVLGLASWAEWIRGLGYFQETVNHFESMKGNSLTHDLPALAVTALALAAIALAFAGRGRNSLARFGIASIVASPTLYVHGLGPMLPGVLALRPVALWFVLGLVPWGAWGLPVPGAWVAVLITSAALLVPGGDDLRVSADLSDDESDLHPVGAGRSVWPTAA